MVDTPNPLEFVSTPALIREIRARHDDFVLVAAQHRSKTFDDVIVSFGGSLHGVFGLLSLANIALETGVGGPDDDEKDKDTTG